MTVDKIPCSVLVLTLNAGSTLDRCLRNLAPFGEILVHDGNSTDDTVAIARRYGARVLKQEETDAPNVRVKDFTQMRLRQRADAAYDWVLYLDADEELSDELVPEIGEILAVASSTTVVKIPRLPLVGGKPRRGLWLEVVPRIHHRRSGCTLKAGKTVHEKYVYDASFTEIVTRHPLYFPLEPLVDRRAKDERYLMLEVDRIRRDGMRWGRFLHWSLREIALMVVMVARILIRSSHFLRSNAVPFGYEWRQVWYHWRLLRAVTGAMIEHPWTAGRASPR